MTEGLEFIDTEKSWTKSEEEKRKRTFRLQLLVFL